MSKPDGQVWTNSYTDDADFKETLTSTATAAVVASPYGEVIWSATMTVEEFVVGGLTFLGYSKVRNVGSLDPNPFSYGGANITVKAIFYTFSNDLEVGFANWSSLGSADLNLYLGGTDFLIQDPSSDSDGRYIFPGNRGLSWIDGQMVEVRLAVNREPTVTITGTAEVGQTLTAVIDEPDGLPAGDQITYQWIRVDGGTETDIPGATSATYTLVDDDDEKSIKVAVSYTDNANFAESLTSRATAIGTVTLVSNIGQSNTGASNFIARDIAQAFTTGPNSTGYTLESVGIDFFYDAVTPPTHTVSIWTESSGSPGSSLGSLTNPASFVTGVNDYTTTGIRLSADTTYFIVMDSISGSGDFESYSTTSDAEDSGAAAGWSIDDDSLFRLSPNPPKDGV